MQIEPAALYPLFEELIVPGQIPVKKEEPIKESTKKAKVGINMFFEGEPAQDENELLNKIIAAIGIEANEINKHFDVPFESINQCVKESESICILWGIDYPQTEKYTIMQIERSKIIVSDKLELIKTDQVVKAKLWNCLKEAFGR